MFFPIFPLWGEKLKPTQHSTAAHICFEFSQTSKLSVRCCSTVGNKLERVSGACIFHMVHRVPTLGRGKQKGGKERSVVQQNQQEQNVGQKHVKCTFMTSVSRTASRKRSISVRSSAVTCSATPVDRS